MNPHAQPFSLPGSDPFAEIQRRHEADWKHLFLAEPLLLEGNSNAGLIRCWEEIPDVFTLAAPATEWIVDGLVPRASVTLIAGEPGSYKTWLALALLRGVAGGGNFLGRACAHTSVLYLDRAIRLHPGQSGRFIVEVSRLPKGRARAVLERHDGKLWQSQPGPRRANLYFPTETISTAGPDA